jgi:hypothetical protein
MGIQLRIFGSIKGQKKKTDKDFVELAAESRRVDKEGKDAKGLEMVKLTLDPSKIANTSHRITAFQGGTLKATTGRNNIVQFSTALDVSHNGNAEVSSATFTADDFGRCNCWIPKSEHNTKALVLAHSANPNKYTIHDEKLNKEVETASAKVTKTRDAAVEALKKEAVENVEQVYAKLVTSLKEQHGEGYRLVKEYSDTIQPKINAEIIRLRKEK